MVPYYNYSADGIGFEGLANYANNLVDGWLANLFILFIFIITVYGLNKSEWRTSGNITFSLLLCLLVSFMMKLFMTVNDLVIFILSIALAFSIGWGYLDKHKG
jgi:hypothetical protein